MTIERISLTLPAATLAQVAERQQDPTAQGRAGERSTVVARSLDRYYYALQAARRDLSERLTGNECAAILDTLNGTMFAEPFSINHLEHEIADALQYEGLAEKWSLDARGHELSEKLFALSYIEKAAIVDGAERWWNRVARGEKPEYGELLR